MLTRISVFLSVVVWNAQVLAQPVPAAAPPLEIVDCKSLEGLSKPIVSDLGVAVRCRLETGSLKCLPGAQLKADVTGIIDLCVRPDGHPIHAPRCIANRARNYNQSIIERAKHRVETNDGIEYRWLDLPYNIASRKEVLAQSKPINRLGTDACVYLRKEKMYLTRPGRPAMPEQPPR